MAKFLDKKERVIDFQLTPYGKHRLSVGKLKPEYYAFFDNGVIYDGKYGAFEEIQTKIHERIKDETQFIEGILSFEEAENSVPSSQWVGETTEDIDAFALGDDIVYQSDKRFKAMQEVLAKTDYVPGEALSVIQLNALYEAALYDRDSPLTVAELMKFAGMVSRGEGVGYSYKSTSLFDLDITPQQHVPKPNILSFESSIGDAMFEGENTQNAPAFKMLTCAGEITSIKEKDTSKYDFSIAQFDNEVKQINIPQIDITANYILEASSPSVFLSEEVPSDYYGETEQFADGNTIKLKRNDVVIYAEEVNTQLLTENFEIEVFEIVEDISEVVVATGTIDVCNDETTLQVGDTLTINDGITSVVFEIIDNTKADFERAAAFASGRVGVVKSNNYEVNGVGFNRKGTIYNLIAAINQQAGTPDHGYPTYSRYGTDSDGDLKRHKGRCRNDAREGCYYGNHNLKVNIERSVITGLRSFHFNTGDKDPYSIYISNQNTTGPGDPNQAITTTAPADRITPSGFSGGYNVKGTELKRKHFADLKEQIVDGFMVTATESEVKETELTYTAVEYFFNILTDDQVDAKIACSCASTFNRDSYYIDIDFDCIDEDEEMENVYYDIYGSATAPEICNLPSQAADDGFNSLVPDTGDNCEDNE